MRINSVSYNNTPQNQSFGAVKEFKTGAAKKFLGYTREKAFDALSGIKNIDIWVFDKMQGQAKGSVVDGYHIIVKDDTHLIKELVGAPDKKGKILQALDEVLLWFKPEHNKQTAAAIKNTDTLDKQKIEEINGYISQKVKKEELDKAIKESLDGEKFIRDFYNRLHGTTEAAKTESWQDKIDGINLDRIS